MYSSSCCTTSTAHNVLFSIAVHNVDVVVVVVVVVDGRSRAAVKCAYTCRMRACVVWTEARIQELG